MSNEQAYLVLTAAADAEIGTFMACAVKSRSINDGHEAGVQLDRAYGAFCLWKHVAGNLVPPSRLAADDERFFDAIFDADAANVASLPN